MKDANFADVQKRGRTTGCNKVFKWGKRRPGSASQEYLQPIDNINRRIFRWGKRSGYDDITPDNAMTSLIHQPTRADLENVLSSSSSSSSSSSWLDNINDMEPNDSDLTVDIEDIPLNNVFLDTDVLRQMWHTAQTATADDASAVYDVMRKRLAAGRQPTRIFKWGKRDVTLDGGPEEVSEPEVKRKEFKFGR